jgi:hypothetical protein
MSNKPFDAEACDNGGQASATNGLSDIETPSKTHRVIDPSRADLKDHTASWTTQSRMQCGLEFCFPSFSKPEM